MGILESIVELLVGLWLGALPLLVGSCIVGSIVAALRTVDGGSTTGNGEPRPDSGFAAEVTVGRLGYFAAHHANARRDAFRVSPETKRTRALQ
jgi:hypothetical protein